MEYNTYIINLKKDKEKWKLIENNFTNSKLNIIRFEAIYKDNTTKYILDNKLSLFCKYFCPKSAIGCGLSHLSIIDYFLNYDNNDYCLILEDDVKPIKENINEDILICIEKYKNEDWDIIKLHNGKVLNNSTAALLISKNGAKKISTKKLIYHIDQQYNLSNLNIIIYDNLFLPNYNNSSNNKYNYITYKYLNKEFKEAPINWYLGMKIINVPIINYEISVLNLIVITLITCVTIFTIKFIYSSKFKHKMPNKSN
jgi:GR25 family glycosyltransferase involved in LPS biosynthesis